MIVYFYYQLDAKIIYFNTFIIILYMFRVGDRGSTVVKVLCYKSEGHWFDPSLT